MTNNFDCSPMPGRGHYAFCLRQMTRMCQCLRRIANEDRSNDLYVISLWKHEMERLIGDQLCRTADVHWFDNVMQKTTNQILSHYDESQRELYQHFVTFPGLASNFLIKISKSCFRKQNTGLKPWFTEISTTILFLNCNIMCLLFGRMLFFFIANIVVSRGNCFIF